MPTKITPFREALSKLQQRQPIGVDLSSSEWADVPLALRERAMFSARTANAAYLQDIKDRVEQILNPKTVLRPESGFPEGRPVTEGMTITSARAELKQILQGLGYDPGEKAGGVQDLSSDSRLNLILKQNVESAQGFGNFLQGQAPGALDEFPAQELFRAEDREEPRDWPTRWMQAGGEIFTGGRMIALKSDPIWTEISAFGVPYPPFDYNSGMWVRDIDRDEAEELGLLKPGEEVTSTVEGFNAKLEASVRDIDPELQRSLQQSFGNQIIIEDGRAKWNPVAIAPIPAPKFPLPPPRQPAPPPKPPEPPAPAPAPKPAPKPEPAPEPVAPPAPAPAPQQRSAPVSAALQLPASGKVRSAAKTAVEAIDAVHDDGKLPVIPVVSRTVRGALGALKSSYNYNGGQTAKEISIRASGPWPALTAVHETGHLLDLEAIGDKGRFATSRGEAGTAAVISALRETNAVKNMQRTMQQADSYRKQRYYQYMLDPRELWARGYAQFITESSGDKKLAAELDKVRGAEPDRHWTKEDFAPVRAAFQALFKSLNWL